MSDYTNFKYINESTNAILNDLNDNLKDKYSSGVEQILKELYKNEVRQKIEKMGERNPQIVDFLNEMYANSNYNMDEFDPKYLKENQEKYKDQKGGIVANIIDKNNKAQSGYQIESFFEKYDQIFDKNTPHDKIIDKVASRFLELNGELHNKIEHNAIYNEAEQNLSKTLSNNITTRINIDIDPKKLKSSYEINKFKKLLNNGKEFKGDENKALFQTLKMMDKALMDENNKDFKAVYEKVGLDFTDINGNKIKIDAKLGEGYFQKDLDHLIKMGCNDCNIGNASKIANKLFINSTELKEPILEKNKEPIKEIGKGLEFKNPATLDNFEKCLKSGMEATAALAESIGDESITAFTQNLSRVAGISGLGKHISNTIAPQNDKNQSKEVMNRLGLAYEEKVKNGAIKLPREKVMEHSNQKSLGASR